MIGIKVDPEFKKFLQNMAAEENRNLSSFILNAILTHIKEHKGIDWHKKNEKKAKK
jgi:uncharacterized protein (DUF1778 family)